MTLESKLFTILHTGTDTIVLDNYDLDIEEVILMVGSSASEFSAGHFDASDTFSASSKYGDTSDSKTLIHYRDIGGVKTKVLETTVTALDVGEFSISTTVCTSSIQIRYVAKGTQL